MRSELQLVSDFLGIQLAAGWDNERADVLLEQFKATDFYRSIPEGSQRLLLEQQWFKQRVGMAKAYAKPVFRYTDLKGMELKTSYPSDLDLTYDKISQIYDPSTQPKLTDVKQRFEYEYLRESCSRATGKTSDSSVAATLQYHHQNFINVYSSTVNDFWTTFFWLQMAYYRLASLWGNRTYEQYWDADEKLGEHLIFVQTMTANEAEWVKSIESKISKQSISRNHGIAERDALGAMLTRKWLKVNKTAINDQVKDIVIAAAAYVKSTQSMPYKRYLEAQLAVTIENYYQKNSEVNSKELLAHLEKKIQSQPTAYKQAIVNLAAEGKKSHRRQIIAISVYADKTANQYRKTTEKALTSNRITRLFTRFKPKKKVRGSIAIRKQKHRQAQDFTFAAYQMCEQLKKHRDEFLPFSSAVRVTLGTVVSNPVAFVQSVDTLLVKIREKFPKLDSADDIGLIIAALATEQANGTAPLPTLDEPKLKMINCILNFYYNSMTKPSAEFTESQQIYLQSFFADNITIIMQLAMTLGKIPEGLEFSHYQNEHFAEDAEEKTSEGQHSGKTKLQTFIDSKIIPRIKNSLSEDTDSSASPSKSSR